MVGEGFNFDTAHTLASVGDGMLTAIVPGDKQLEEVVTATVYVNENYRVAIRYSRQSWLAIDMVTGSEEASKNLVSDKGFSLKHGWTLGDSPIAFMYTQSISKMRKYGHIMGVMYGIIAGYETSNQPIVYQQLNYDVCTGAKCSYQDLIDTSKELLRYAGIVQKFLEDRGEL